MLNSSFHFFIIPIESLYHLNISVFNPNTCGRNSDARLGFRGGAVWGGGSSLPPHAYVSEDWVAVEELKLDCHMYIYICIYI